MTTASRLGITHLILHKIDHGLTLVAAVPYEWAQANLGVRYVLPADSFRISDPAVTLPEKDHGVGASDGYVLAKHRGKRIRPPRLDLPAQ